MDSVTNRRLFWRYLEVAALSGVLCLLFILWQQAKPVVPASQLQWLWIAPVVFALRYGLLAGGFSYLLMLAIFLQVDWHGATVLLEQKNSLIFGLFVTLLAGEFSDSWRTQLRREAKTNEHLRQRLSHATKAYQHLHYSHDLLEQTVLHHPVSMRSAFEEIRKLLQASNGVMQTEILQRLLNLIGYYCQVGSASLLLCKNGALQTSAVATLGSPKPVSPTTALLQQAMRDPVPHYHTINERIEDTATELLAVIPMHTEQGGTLAYLAIENLPFYALHEENLRQMSVMLSYFAEELLLTTGTQWLLERFSDMPTLFASELQTLQRMRQRYQIASHLVGFAIANEYVSALLVQEIAQQSRGLDVAWQFEMPQGDLGLLVLLPFSEATMAHGYLRRMQNWLKTYYRLESAQGQYNVLVKPLSAERLDQQIHHVIQQLIH